MFFGWALALAADDAAGWGDLGDLVQETKVHEALIYGYIDSYYEIVAPVPESVDENGDTVYSGVERGFDVPNLHVMVQGTLHGRYRYFLNLASPGSGSPADDEPVVVRNAWVEAPIVGQKLVVRAGKTYRRFGLYNEILDAVPTFIGIEPPELFDKDHLMLTRTTNLMVHGSYGLGGSTYLNLSATTGNDESIGGVPLGADAHVKGATYRVGSSFYTTGGAAGPTRAVGEGSPRGGVATGWPRTATRSSEATRRRRRAR